MAQDVIHAVCRGVLQSDSASKDISILWHAGEPLVVPPNFYRTAFEILERARPACTKLTHKLQTNGMLLTREWCQLFKEFGVVVGVSIDGPAHIHDLHRRTRGGEGTFSKVMAGIDLLREFEIPFNTIAVLSKQSLESPGEIFQFFESLRPATVMFNVEEIEGINRQSSLNFEAAQERFSSFFKTYLDLMHLHNSTQRLREIHGMLEGILQNDGVLNDNHLTRPFACVSIDRKGNLSTFSPELLGVRHHTYGNFIFGNILHSSLPEMARSRHFRTVWADIERGVQKCRATCEYFPVCGGGSPSNKLAENDDLTSTETLYCRLTVKALTDLILADLGGREHHRLS
jgi:uncharacterized protein